MSRIPAPNGIQLPADYRILSPQKRRLVREWYAASQEGNCYYCKAPLIGEPPASVIQKRVKRHLFPENFFKYPVHLHHSHESGMTIGAVHCYCNAVMWQYHGE